MKLWAAFSCILLILLAGTANAMSPGEKTKHFDIYYPASMQDGGSGGIGPLMEDAYSEINSYYGTCPEHIKVLVVGKKTMDKVGEHVEAFSAWNNKSSAIVLREESMKDKKSLKVVVEHEISHLGINNILANKDPKEFAWMEEGICMVFSKEPFSDQKISKFIVGRGFLSPGEIASAVDSENYNVTKNGYIQSYSLVKYLTLRFGSGAIVNMLKCHESNFDKAFAECTGEDFSTVYRQWQSYVKNTASGWQPAARPAYSAPYYYPFYDVNLEEFLA